VGASFNPRSLERILVRLCREDGPPILSQALPCVLYRRRAAGEDWLSLVASSKTGVPYR
jgi:hypothetical protein